MQLLTIERRVRKNRQWDWRKYNKIAVGSAKTEDTQPTTFAKPETEMFMIKVCSGQFVRHLL